MTIAANNDICTEKVQAIIDKYRYEVATEENCQKVQLEVTQALNPIVPGIEVKAFVDCDGFKLTLTDMEQTYNVDMTGE